jgi:hypothetical protein
MGGSFPQSNRHTNTSGSPTSVCANQSRKRDNSLDAFALQFRPVQNGLIGYAACGGASSRVVEPQCRTRFNHVIRLQPVSLSIEQSNWFGFVYLRALGMGGPLGGCRLTTNGVPSLCISGVGVSVPKCWRATLQGACWAILYIHISGVRGYKVLQNGETLDTYELLVQQRFEDTRRQRMNTSRVNPCTC